ncbi:MAG: HIT family protein [Candidatus Hodarchaeota archaeon]
MRIENCTFCQIIERTISSKIIYENEYVIGFLDIFPISKGHLIIAPKNHYQNIEDIPENDLVEVFKIVKICAKLLHEKLNIDGYNILQNNFRAAGQVIDHFHVHIIPRSINDGKFRLKIPRNQANEKELNEIIKLLNK